MAFLQEIPWRFHFDEGYAYIEAMRYYRGPAIPLFTTTWENTSLPSMWFSFAAGWMHLFGPGLAGVRAGVAFIGAVTVIPVYGLARLVWGRLAAGVAGFGVAVSAVYVHYSRVSIINVTTAFAWAVCFYFLLRGLRSRRPGDFVWSGLAAGLSMYTYYGTRLLPYLLLAFLGYLLIFHFRAFRERVGHLALVALGFVCGFGPLIGNFLLNPEMWGSRAASYMNVPSIIPTTWQGWVDNWNILAPLVVRNFLGLSVIPGRDTVYYAPFLLPPEAVLLVLGAGLLIWRWRQPASFLVLLWGVAVVFTGGTLLDQTTIPNFARWTPAFPAFYLAMALPLALWLKHLMALPLTAHGRGLRRMGARGAAVALLVALLGADLLANAYSYLVQYPPRVPTRVSYEALQGRLVASVGPGVYVRSVGDAPEWQAFSRTFAEMLAPPGTRITRFYNPSRQLPVVGDPDHDLSFLFYSSVSPYLPVVQSYYPGGQVREWRAPDGTLMAEDYFVTAEQAIRQYGVLFAVDDATGARLGTYRVHKVGALPTPDPQGPPLPDVVDGTWSGAFYAGEGGPARLSVRGVDQARLWVQGEQAPFDTPIQVEPGWVRFTLKARVDRSNPIQFLLQEGDLPPVEVDTSRLWPSPPNQGLAATLGGEPVAHRVDPFIGNSLRNPPGASDYLYGDPDALPLGSASGGSDRIRWEGDLHTGDGIYTMELRTDALAQLTVSGRVVVDMCAPQPGPIAVGTGQVQLAAGWHKVRIDYQATGGRDGLEWLWTRPDGIREVVPPSALRIAVGVQGDRAIAWPEAPMPLTCASP